MMAKENRMNCLEEKGNRKFYSIEEAEVLFDVVWPQK